VDDEKFRDAKANVECKMKCIEIDLGTIINGFTRCTVWATADDQQICSAMKSCIDWQKQLAGIGKQVLEVSAIIASKNLTECQQEYIEMEEKVERCGTKLTDAIRQIEQADHDKGLHMDRSVKTCPTKTPTFAAPPQKTC
jgi:hypothetical protein